MCIMWTPILDWIYVLSIVFTDINVAIRIKATKSMIFRAILPSHVSPSPLNPSLHVHLSSSQVASSEHFAHGSSEGVKQELAKRISYVEHIIIDNVNYQKRILCAIRVAFIEIINTQGNTTGIFMPW